MQVKSESGGLLNANLDRGKNTILVTRVRYRTVTSPVFQRTKFQ